MAFQQYFVQECGPENISACFDCSICLEFARDPVVTLCGYLYRWPCIYKWFNSQSVSPAPNELPYAAMPPGLSFSKPEQEADAIPPRPSASGIQHLPSHNLHEDEQNILDTG
ncbi:uncharacterized protein [Primulina huaijiensis]|uniref:uncharacterized protein n=1 Tax=Primulina huaijiensis TaxID=1492673 RepID=UPI003CC70815